MLVPWMFRESKYIIAWCGNIPGTNIHLWPRFLNERPEVNVGPVDVPAPGDDVFRFAELLRFCSQLAPDHCDHGVAAGGGADSAVQLRSAQSVEEAMRHAGVVQVA